MMMVMARAIGSAGFLLLCLGPGPVAPFSRDARRHRPPARGPAPTPEDGIRTATAPSPRRSFLHDLSAAAAAAALVAAGPGPLGPAPARAAVLDPVANDGGTLGTLSVAEAEERFRAGRASVDSLLRNYDEVCEGGGDNVRRYLGTVGTTSGLFGIRKAMKALAERADDIVEYTELSREIEQTIEQADGSAYMAIFVTTSTSYTPPEKYFKDAKIEIERCAKSMDELAAMIGLKL